MFLLLCWDVVQSDYVHGTEGYSETEGYSDWASLALCQPNMASWLSYSGALSLAVTPPTTVAVNRLK